MLLRVEQILRELVNNPGARVSDVLSDDDFEFIKDILENC